jgi:branched-subunit amino acid transport protein
MRTWAVIVGAGLASLVIRAVFLAGPAQFSVMPQRTKVVLSMIPAAALGALAMPAVLSVDGQLTFDQARILAALTAVLVAWRWRSIVLSLIAGIAAIMLLDPLLS